MKKNISFIIILVMIMSIFAGCAGKDKEPNKGNDNTDGQETKVEFSEAIAKIYGIKDSGLSLADIPVNMQDMDAVKYNTGLTDVSKVKAIAVSEPMMSSQAYSLVLLQLKNAADAEVVATEMLAGIDQRKWICVDADDLQIVAKGDVIMLIMVSSDLEDTVTSQEMVDAFKKVYGDKLDVELTK